MNYAVSMDDKFLDFHENRHCSLFWIDLLIRKRKLNRGALLWSSQKSPKYIESAVWITSPKSIVPSSLRKIKHMVVFFCFFFGFVFKKEIYSIYNSFKKHIFSHWSSDPMASGTRVQKLENYWDDLTSFFVSIFSSFISFCLYIVLLTITKIDQRYLHQ